MTTATVPITTTPTAAANGSGADLRAVRLGQLRESPTNPRKRFGALEELTASLRTKGLLTPLLVRPLPSSAWPSAKTPLHEIVAGHRRFRAAKAADLPEVLCLVRELTDAEVIEIQVIENNQREDVHPLEEAEGYRQLMTMAKYDVARIAERVGRSVKYVYDRIKLLSLTKPAQQLFLDGTITAGHAILLARLTPEAQARAIGSKDADYRDGGLLKEEHTLWDPADRGDSATFKPISVRELQTWIDERVKFDKDAADPMLFPETVGTVQAARAAKEKIVQITHEYVVPEDARDPKERIYTERSWRPADGTGKAKACEYAVTGVIVVGPGRGEAHKVCLAKERCKTHWSKWQKERAAPAEGAATPGGRPAARDHWKQEEARRKAEQAREEAERARWKKAEPKILEAVAAAVKKASARATGLLAEIVLSACQDYRTKDVTEYVPRGTTAEDLVRHAAFTILADEVRDTWQAPEKFPKRAKTLGLDVKKLVDQVAQPPKPEEPTKTKKAAKPAKAKARTKAKRKAA